MIKAHKYWKKERCDYPVANDGISYCFGYASFVDEDKVNPETIKEFESKSCACGGYKEGDACEFYIKENK